MIGGQQLKICNIILLAILSLFLLSFQFSLHKYSECIPIDVHEKAILQLKQQLHRLIEIHGAETKKSSNVSAVLSDNYSKSDSNNEADHLKSYGYSFKKIFLDCLGSEYWNIISKIVFGKNVQIIPFDVQFAECVLNKNGQQQKKPKTLRFGVIDERVNGTFESLIRYRKGFCSRTIHRKNCLVLKCKDNLTLHFVRLINKTDYWMGTNCMKHSNYISTRFAIKKFNTQFVPTYQSVVAYPLDTIRFQKHLTYSNLVECNRTWEAYVKSSFPSYYNQTPTMSQSSFQSLVKLRDMLHGARMTPMLACGTLLGWARECGIIPYTHDYDLMVLNDEYNEHFEEMITENTDFYLKFRFNKLNDSLEYTLKNNKKVRFDVFFLYQEETHSWIGGMAYKRTKYKFTYPRLKQICSADLLGYLFHVPCNYLEYIVAEYDSAWMIPIHQDDFEDGKISKIGKKIKKFTWEEYYDNFVEFN